MSINNSKEKQTTKEDDSKTIIDQANEDIKPPLSITLQQSETLIRAPSTSSLTVERTTTPRTPSRSRSYRFNTICEPMLLELKELYTYDVDEKKNTQNTQNDDDDDDDDDDSDDEFFIDEDTNNQKQISEYGFGVGFSYYKKYPYYPYVTAKYKDLKHELLNNDIQKITIEQFNQIYMKGSQCQQTCKIVALDDLFWNQLFKIKKQSQISVQHILSILFYTDLNDLPKEMKYACRKMTPNESVQAVKNRHRNFVHWLKLLFETIMLFGGKYTTKSKPIYHGLDIKFNFSQFKAGFFIPTSTTTELGIARGFAEDNGIIVQFGGFESIGCNRYFDTSGISAYAHEKEYLFFFAELHIREIICGSQKFAVSPLSLYESIVSGCNIVEKVQLKKKQFKDAQIRLNKYLDECDNDMEHEIKNEAEQYGINIFKNYRRKCKDIHINPEVIMQKITFPKLREKFIKQNGKKEFEGYSDKLLSWNEVNIKGGYYFKWVIDRQEINEWKTEWKDEDESLPSEVFECDDGKVVFYAQMNYIERHDSKPFGRITLFLYELQDDKTKLDNVSFDIYCKKLDKYYARLEKIDFDISEQGIENEQNFQGQSFDINLLDKALNKYEEIEWEFTIRYAAV